MSSLFQYSPQDNRLIQNDVNSISSLRTLALVSHQNHWIDHLDIRRFRLIIVAAGLFLDNFLKLNSPTSFAFILRVMLMNIVGLCSTRLLRNILRLRDMAGATIHATPDLTVLANSRIAEAYYSLKWMAYRLTVAFGMIVGVAWVCIDWVYSFHCYNRHHDKSFLRPNRRRVNKLFAAGSRCVNLVF